MVTGLTIGGVADLASALVPIASQLTHLTLDSYWCSGPETSSTLRLLSACTGLPHLTFENLNLDGDLTEEGTLPSYHLASLTLLYPRCHLDQDDLACFLGDSAATLRSFGRAPLRPAAWRALTTLVPALVRPAFPLVGGARSRRWTGRCGSKAGQRGADRDRG